MDVGDTLHDIGLFDPDGTPVALSDVVDGPTILVLPRYFSCLPCQQFMYALNDRLDELRGAGVSVAAISARAAHQARWLRDEQGVRYPLLLDPEHELCRAIDLGRFRPWEIVKPKVYRNYLPAFRRRWVTRDDTRSRQGVPADPFQLPGVVVVDGERRLLFVHRGEGLGDYPPIEELIQAALAHAA
ncbi:MAG: redoxin domain-containing protein [Nitriliruptorales bacterium]|nr:redoxin domain-containing protein [Nitriliruptorales bacterium]